MTFNQKLDWFWHIIEMLVMAGIVGGMWYAYAGTLHQSALIGLSFGIGHFHGREKRDCEVKFKIPSPHLVSYWFGRWNHDQLTDFFAPAAVGVLLMVLVTYDSVFG